MNKHKLTLEELKVESFITSFEADHDVTLKGGKIVIGTHAGTISNTKTLALDCLRTKIGCTMIVCTNDVDCSLQSDWCTDLPTKVLNECGY